MRTHRAGINIEIQDSVPTCLFGHLSFRTTLAACLGEKGPDLLEIHSSFPGHELFKSYLK